MAKPSLNTALFSSLLYLCLYLRASVPLWLFLLRVRQTLSSRDVQRPAREYDAERQNPVGGGAEP